MVDASVPHLDRPFDYAVPASMDDSAVPGARVRVRFAGRLTDGFVIARIDDTEKNWKFSAADIEERKYWDDYMDAYEHCLSSTSTENSPWYVVPADDKENARLIVSQVIVETLEALNMKYPETTPARRKELLRLRRQLLK